jgi:hypothetical protein
MPGIPCLVCGDLHQEPMCRPGMGPPGTVLGDQREGMRLASEWAREAAEERKRREAAMIVGQANRERAEREQAEATRARLVDALPGMLRAAANVIESGFPVPRNEGPVFEVWDALRQLLGIEVDEE